MVFLCHKVEVFGDDDSLECRQYQLCDEVRLDNKKFPLDIMVKMEG